jgi:phosphatidylglycerol:prolipoprotein diacylglycerol transferase
MFPVWLRFGWFDLPSYTALLLLALSAGLAVTCFAARYTPLPVARILDAALATVVAGVIGGRAVYVGLNWGYYQSHADMIAYLWQGGLSWHGGVAGGLIGALMWCAWRKLDARVVLAALTPGLLAGAALGWIGAQLAGLAYGREILPGDRWWFLAADLPDVYGFWNPRFPAQGLGAAWAAWCALLALMLVRLARRTPALTAAMLGVYSAGAVALGLARGDETLMLGAWRIDQLLDAALAALALAYLAGHIARAGRAATHT